jgi:hypothetical protein
VQEKTISGSSGRTKLPAKNIADTRNNLTADPRPRFVRHALIVPASNPDHFQNPARS